MPVPLEGIPQRHVATKFGTVVTAYIGEAVGYKIRVPAEDVEVIFVVRNKAEIDRLARVLGMKIDTSLSIPVAVIRQSEANLQVPAYLPTAKPFTQANPEFNNPKGDTPAEDW